MKPAERKWHIRRGSCKRAVSLHKKTSPQSLLHSINPRNAMRTRSNSKISRARKQASSIESCDETPEMAKSTMILKLRRGGGGIIGAILRRMRRSTPPSREKGRPGGVPGDVKEGQFAVYAGSGSELRRFVVDLECLTEPAFLGLLQRAEEEFGFAQEGPLHVPCRPGDFAKILRGAERAAEAPAPGT